MKNNNYTLVRSILGNEIFRNEKTGKEYLATLSKTGKSKLLYLKPKIKTELEAGFEKLKKHSKLFGEL